MAPGRRKGRAAAAAAARQQWKVGDLVLAKMKGFPAWPAMVSEPEKWGYSSDRKKLLVYFYGTKQIAFCNYADIEAFTEEKKKSLLVKRQGKGADFVRAVDEIIDIYETLKKQNLSEVNSGDEGIASNAGKLEGSRSKSFRKSPEISCHITHNHQSEAHCASIESRDVLNPEEIPVTSMEGDFHNICTVTNDLTEKVSILDQLRQTPLSTTTTTRKRLRDGSLQSSVIQRLPSLRRSRSSSGGDPYKFQKSIMILNGADVAGSCLVPDAVQEESTMKKKLTGEVAHISVCCDGITPDSAGLPCNGSSEDIVSEMAAMRSEAEGMLESSCKLEKSVNGYVDKDLGLNGGVRLNGKLDFPIKTVILKKKRKPNRKRVTNTRECATLDKESGLRAELHESLSESPNSRIEVIENFSKADGDEHLPLVKRARVRMGKPPVEERQLDDSDVEKEELEMEAPVDNSNKYPTSSSPVNSCPVHRTSFRVKEAASSSPIDDCTLSAGRDPIFWKVNKYQLKGISLDVEAALPPSKRLHRALEAMSANAAEATDDNPEVPNDMEMISNGCTDSPKTIHPSVDGNVGSPTRSQHIQSSDSTAFHSSASGLSSSLTLQSLDAPMLTSSEVEADNTHTGNLSSPHNKDCKETQAGVRDCDGPFTSKVADIDIYEKFLQPCSFKSAEKQINATSSESLSDQLSSPLGNENEYETLQPSKECSHLRGDIVGEYGAMEPNIQKPDSVLNYKKSSDFFPANGTAVILSATNIGSTASNTSGSTKSPSSQCEESVRARDIQDVSKEVKHKSTPKDWGISSDLTPMKDLLAAAHKRLPSRSTSFSDNAVDGKVVPDAVVSPSVMNREDSSVQGSPLNPMIYNRPASDDRTHHLQNGRRSPFVSQREKHLNKLTAHVEANAARRSFEALLCTLSRTKESIGRATRVAIDCAKYGIAGEVIEILLQYLEKESSLYKRVDLFFLVDSITQCSRSQKGGAGDVYLSLVQLVLPRLLSAAAPHGNAAWENRRQCLKVLRLWLERKTLPESIVRHHIREFESVNEASLTSSYSRRPPRTERALNDPIREMEGMFVDEYGSNTSFQLQHFLRPRVLEDEEESADDEKSFEAVTPERNSDVDEKGTAQTSTEKHRHILEDVDGELEMEDVAPSCGAEVSSACDVAGSETVCDTHYQLEQHQSLPFPPPLPENLPPSPPPLPSSPPPMAPPCSTPLSFVPQQQEAGSHAHTDVTDFHLSSITHNIQNQQPQSIGQQPNNFHGKLMSLEAIPYYAHGYGGFSIQMPPPLSSLSSSGSYGSHPVMHSGNIVQPTASVPLHNKAYHLQPPPPTVSNQFSYVQAEPQQRAQSWGSCPSFSDRFQYVHDPQGGKFFGDRGTRGPIQHENAERGRFSPAVNTGPLVSDKAETLPSSLSLHGPPSEPSPNPCRGWSFPPRTSNYSVSASRPLENPISRVSGAPGYWRPR